MVLKMKDIRKPHQKKQTKTKKNTPPQNEAGLNNKLPSFLVFLLILIVHGQKVFLSYFFALIYSFYSFFWCSIPKPPYLN